MQRLFVGGGLDGEWREACDYSQTVPCSDPANRSEWFKSEVDSPGTGPAIKYETYHAQPWQAGHEKVYVMALEGLLPDDVMKRLMNGYCPAVADKRGGDLENGRTEISEQC